MRELLGTGLLVIQAAFLLPMLVAALRGRSAAGVSLVGEALWVAGGLGWFVHAMASDNGTIMVSACLGMTGSGLLLAVVWRHATPRQRARATVALLFSLVAGGATVIGLGTTGLSVLLAVFGCVQFAPHLATAWTLLTTGTTADGLSVPGTALRAMYGAGWAVYASGWGLYGIGGDGAAWPLFVWGVAGTVAFTTQVTVARAVRRRHRREALVLAA